MGNDPLNRGDPTGNASRSFVTLTDPFGFVIKVPVVITPNNVLFPPGAVIEGGVREFQHWKDGDAGRPSDGLPVQDDAKVERPGKTGVRDQVYGKPGGVDQANGDFDKSANPDTVQDRGDGIRTGKTPGGANITVRPKSDDGRPTVDVTTGRGKERDTDKFRYGSKSSN